MHPHVVVRTAEERDIGELAALRWVWSPPAQPDDREALRDFTEWLADWMTAHRDDVLCKIAVADGRLIGMAWLAIYERVPNPDDRRRRTGDVQSVFVLPRFRGRGVGRRLMSELCAAADDLGIPTVTVRSSASAMPFYERLGFTPSEFDVERHRPAPPADRRSR
ncbi:GNAT family N-acetyltransferase [Lysobacter korlensis]|uniref:GNAT family N-acetyltransferase n=1 Tax=Lysobacter korlensis TaxID=553636 RepID=A0ABV6RWX3_9GAMM